jgi:alpha-beta hydrolase superfamily lysophospholipase
MLFGFKFFECCNPQQALAEPDHLKGAKRISVRSPSNLYRSGDSQLSLFFERWEEPARRPRALVIIHPGETETAGWYNGLAQKLTRAHCSVFAPDMQGFGQSDGMRGYFEHFDHLVSDFAAFVEQRIDEAERARRPGNPTPKVFLVGKGLGALVVMHCVSTMRTLDPVFAPSLILLAGGFEFANRFTKDAGITCEPGGSATCQLVDSTAAVETGIARTAGVSQASQWFPKMHVSPPVAADTLVRDPQVAERMRRDVLVYLQGYRARVLGEILEWQARLQALLKVHPEIFNSLSALFLHGTGDTLYSSQGSQNVCDRWSSTIIDRKLVPRIKLYEGAFHMLMQEPCKDEVFSDIQTFILQICDAEWAGGMDGRLRTTKP